MPVAQEHCRAQLHPDKGEARFCAKRLDEARAVLYG